MTAKSEVTSGQAPIRAEKVKRPPAKMRHGTGRGGTRRRRRRRVRAFVRRDQLAALIAAEPLGAWQPAKELMFLKLGQRTLLEHVVDRLHNGVAEVLVAVPAAEVERARRLLGNRATVHPAESTHLQSIARLFATTTAPWLLLHDVSWPLFSRRLAENVVARAMEAGAAAAVDMPERPPGRLEAADGFMSLSDSPLGIVQSPAVFRRDLLQRVLPAEGAGNAGGLTLWECLRLLPMPIAPVRNDPWNRRIASQLDWDIMRHAIWPTVRPRLAGGAKPDGKPGGKPGT